MVETAAKAGAIECWTSNYNLPYLLGVHRPADVPGAPYLRGPDTFRRLPGDYRVGVVWAGGPHSNDALRSTRLAHWAPVLGVAGAKFFSLQVGPPAQQLRGLAPGVIEDLGPELMDWSCTAAAMMQLDLVIAVDTAVAHLAGALGVPLWLCLPATCEYRWMLEGATTHWYVSARLFRQSRVGEWPALFESVAAALRELVQRRGGGGRLDSSHPA